MNSVLEIEQAIKQLPQQERLEIARWLLEDLQEGIPTMHGAMLKRRDLPRRLLFRFPKAIKIPCSVNDMEHLNPV